MGEGALLQSGYDAFDYALEPLDCAISICKVYLPQFSNPTALGCNEFPRDLVCHYWYTVDEYIRVAILLKPL